MHIHLQNSEALVGVCLFPAWSIRPQVTFTLYIIKLSTSNTLADVILYYRRN